MEWLLPTLTLAVLAICLYGAYALVRRSQLAAASERRHAAQAAEMTGAEETDATAALPARRRPAWFGPLGALLLVGLLVAGYYAYEGFTARSPSRFVVLIAPFDDGGNGETGQNVASSLARLLREQSREPITVATLATRPADAQEALNMATASGADLLVWGGVEPGSMLDGVSLSTRLIYTPTGPYAPNGWDGYLGRFAMPRSFTLSSAPVNGRAAVAPLLLALADYSRGDVDLALDTIDQLVASYPALDGPLVRALRGNVFWARMFYGDAANEYRVALEQPGVEQALLANNLGAILLDAGDPTASAAFGEAVRLLEGRDLGELRFNLGMLYLAEQRYSEAVVDLEVARNLLSANTPLELALADAYTNSGRLEGAATALRSAAAQSQQDMSLVPSLYRTMARQRSDAALAERQALLDLAETLAARGRLLWELEASGPLEPNQIDGLRDTLNRAADISAQEATRWRQRSAADAAAYASTGQTATGQAERALRTESRQRYYQALLETELARVRRQNSASTVFSRLFGALFGNPAALTGHIGLIRKLDEEQPDQPATLALLARALRFDGQLDAADATYDRVINLSQGQPEGYFGKGMVALDRGDPATAQALWTTATEQSSAFFPARSQLALLAEAQGDWPAAIAQRRALAELRPGEQSITALAQDLRRSGATGFAEAEQQLLPLVGTSAVAAIELGRLYNDAGQPQAAAQAYRDALRVAPESSTAAFELGETLARLGDLAGAEQALRDALRFDETNIDARLRLARLYRDELGRPEDAGTEYAVLLRQGVRSSEQYLDIGDAAMQQRDYPQAITAYERYLRDQPDDPRARHKLGGAYLAANRLDSAAQAEQQVLDRTADGSDPGLRAEALVRLGDVSRLRGEPDSAGDYYTQALSLSPQLIEAQLGLGQLAVGQGNWGVAQGYFETAAALPGGLDNPAVQFWLGEALLRSSDLPRAVGAYERALQLQPTFPEALLGLAQLRYTQGDIPAALTTVAAARGQRANYAEALLFEGKLLQEQSRFEEAFVAYDRSIDANNRIAESYYRRALLQIRNEDNAAAVGDLQRAVELQPNFPEAHYWLGRAFYAQGRLESALNALRRAIGFNANYVEAIYYSGRVSEDLGQRPDAISAYQTVLALDGQGEWGALAQTQLDQLG